MNPYSVLKIRRNASAETVRRAYRKAALRVHPDRGGSADEFERVNLAYQVLNDPGARAHYDATGEVRRPDRRGDDVGPVLAVLSQAFLTAVSGLAQAGRKPSDSDVITLMRTAIDKSRSGLRDQAAKMRKAEAVLADSVGRFQTDDEDNVLESMVAAQLAGLRQEVAQHDRQAAVHDQAVEYLRRYRFRHARPAQDWSTATSFVTLTAV